MHDKRYRSLVQLVCVRGCVRPCLLRGPSSMAVGVGHLVIVAVLCLRHAAAQPAPELLLQGRFGGKVDEQTRLSSLPVVFSWAASSVYTTFISSSVNVTLTNVVPSVASSAYNRFVFSIDQYPVAVESTGPQIPVISWSTSGLGSDPHNLTITKLSEPSYGQATLNSITLEGNGR